MKTKCSCWGRNTPEKKQPFSVHAFYQNHYVSLKYFADKKLRLRANETLQKKCVCLVPSGPLQEDKSLLLGLAHCVFTVFFMHLPHCFQSTWRQVLTAVTSSLFSPRNNAFYVFKPNLSLLIRMYHCISKCEQFPYNLFILPRIRAVFRIICAKKLSLWAHDSGFFPD